MGWKELPIDRLDPDTRRYLEMISAEDGRGQNGYFVRDRQHHWNLWLGFFGAIAVLAWAFSQASIDPRGLILLQIVALGAVVCVALAILRVRRRMRKYGKLCNFKFIDGRAIWHVTDKAVYFVPHRDISALKPHHIRQGERYRFTEFDIATKTGPAVLRIRGFKEAETFYEYYQALQGVLDLLAEKDQAGNPALLGMLASRIHKGTDDVPKGMQVPHPRIMASKRRLQLEMPYWIMGTVVIMIGVSSIPAANQYLHGERLFSLTQSEHAKLYDCNHYLRTYPNGVHAMEVLKTRDDLFFYESFEIAMRDHSPRALRAYLLDTRTLFHREEAQAQINDFYNQAIARLRAAGESDNADPGLVRGMVALLEQMKYRLTPYAEVAFSGAYEELPKGEAAIRETDSYEAYLRDRPELLTAVELSSNQSATLPLGEVFDADWLLKREDVLLSRLSDATAGALNPNLIQFRKATSPHPDLRVQYQIKPQGNLYLYSTGTSRTQFERAMKKNSEDIVRGLIRGYDVEWQLTLHPRGTRETFSWEIGSVAAPSLNYDQRPGDPEWAPYAVVLHSAFVDISDELISKIGLQPPPKPRGFLFREVDLVQDDRILLTLR